MEAGSLEDMLDPPSGLCVSWLFGQNSVSDERHRSPKQPQTFSLRVQLRVVAVRAKQEVERLLKQHERDQRAVWFSEGKKWPVTLHNNIKFTTNS